MSDNPTHECDAYHRGRILIYHCSICGYERLIISLPTGPETFLIESGAPGVTHTGANGGLMISAAMKAEPPAPESRDTIRMEYWNGSAWVDMAEDISAPEEVGPFAAWLEGIDIDGLLDSPDTPPAPE